MTLPSIKLVLVTVSNSLVDWVEGYDRDHLLYTKAEITMTKRFMILKSHSIVCLLKF